MIPKFRGRSINPNNQLGEWVYGSVLTNKLGTYIITEENPHECTQYGYIEINEYVRVDPDSIGQYTGFKDINDVEIYDGNTVRLNKYETFHEMRHINKVGKINYSNGKYYIGNFEVLGYAIKRYNIEVIEVQTANE